MLAIGRQRAAISGDWNLFAAIWLLLLIPWNISAAAVCIKNHPITEKIAYLKRLDAGGTMITAAAAD